MTKGRAVRSFAASAVVLAMLAYPALAQQRRFDIPAQKASSSITMLGRQADIQILAARRVTEGVRTNAVRGAMEVEQALKLLLAGTGLDAKRSGKLIFVIVTAQEPARRDTGSDPADAQGPDIIVTGSRLPGSQATSQPVAIADARDMKERAAINIASVIDLLPQSGTPESGRGAQGENVGRDYINLFGLGSQRTLTLVNGRRFVSSNPAAAGTLTPGSQVDLNNIPANLVERVEIVPATGAAIYGSDAIAGVANIILKDKVEGIEIGAQSGISSRGDAATHRLTLLAGQSFAGDRGHLTLSLEHAETAGLVGKDRGIFADGSYFVRNPANTGSSDGIPATILVKGRRIPELSDNGVPFLDSSYALSSILTMADPQDASKQVPVQFSSTGDLVPYNLGTYYSAGSSVGGDGYDLADATSLLTPVRRDVAYGLGRFAFNDRLTLGIELSTARVVALELNSQGLTFNSNLLPAPLSGTLLSVSNPFLSDQAHNVLTAAGVSSFYLARANRDLLIDNNLSSRRRTSRMAATLDGTIGEDRWHWSLSATYGRSSGTISNYAIDTQRYLNAVDAVRTSDGGIACAITVANPGSIDPDIADCKPLNLFGLGAADAAARSYINALLKRRFDIRQTDMQAGFSGKLFDLPGGPLALSLGYEHRHERSDYWVNEAMASGRTRGGITQAVSGAYSTDELYGEIRLPLTGPSMAVPLAHSLTLEAAGRLARNSRAGLDHAWSAGLKWEPVDGILARGSASRTFRAPAVVELFLPVSSSLNFVAVDPCDARQIHSGGNPSARLANCRALFASLSLPSDFALTSTAQNAAVLTTVGGNADLRNEHANSWTAGVVLRPAFLPGFSLSADLLSIDLKDTIVNFDAVAILSTCFDAVIPSQDVCSRITRDSAAQITSARTGYVNAGYTRYRSRNYAISYQVPLASLFRHAADPGALDIRLDVVNTRRLETSVSGLGFDLDPVAGEINAPRWKAQLTSRYTRGRMTLSWFANYIGPVAYDALYTTEDADTLRVGRYVRHDAALTMRLPRSMEFGLNASNIFDAQPAPLSLSSQGTAGSYDVIGRSFTVSARARF